ncbi:hypothetical protein QFZ51_004041 [Chitinophaga sp. W3I9]|uniref:hypothetical protein n=1 Tax=unclassified Chitinophaga TaxID=2619133 RepID=UPI0035257775
MKPDNIFHLPGIKMPELTHQKIQELKKTAKGKLITGTPMEAFQALVSSMEIALQEQLAQYDYIQQTVMDSAKRKMLLLEMLDDHLYLEFAYHIMFIKWREQQISKAS